MSLLRRNPKRDYGEERVMRALAECGCSVFQLSGSGLPDLLCFTPRARGKRSRAFLVEVKNTAKDKLTPAQERFHGDAWANEWPVYVVHDDNSILNIVNEVSK